MPDFPDFAAGLSVKSCACRGDPEPPLWDYNYIKILKECHHTQNRTRSIQLIVRVTPEEKDFINKKMELCNTSNFNAFACKMLINGYIVNLDLEKFQLLAKEVNRIGNNINQIAKISNATGMVFGDDINKLKEMVDEIWRLLKSSLSELLSKSR